MKILNISSGGTKFIGLVTASRQILKHYTPDIITGVSAGAIASVPCALGYFDECIDRGLALTLDDMFSISPVKKSGNVRLTRALFKHGSFGEQKIDKLLGSLITEELYYQYQDGNYPTCLVQTVNRKTKEIKVWNLKSTKLDYTDYLNIVSASAAIPIWIPYMKAVVQNSDKKDFTQPRGIKFVRIDGKTGNIASRLSQKILVAPFKDGTEPKVVEGETNIEDVDEAQFFRQNY